METLKLIAHNACLIQRPKKVTHRLIETYFGWFTGLLSWIICFTFLKLLIFKIKILLLCCLFRLDYLYNIY